MPTGLPRRKPADCPFLHLIALPLALLVLSAFIESRTLTIASLLHVVARSGELIANAEFGPGLLLRER